MDYKYYKIGKRKLEKMLEETPRDNANLGYNPETVNKYICDEVFKQYALDKMPLKARELYEEGILHHHDLEYCMTRPNCMNYDIRFFAKNGLKIDGIGDMGSVAKPANNLEVILNHLLQALMAGSICFSGGQGLANFNTFLAPYCRDRDYYEIKQAIQGFIFNCNMSLVSKGGQIIFSSIGVDLSIPDVLKNEPAISLGGVANGVYGDYEKEFNLLFKAICEVINEKDATGNYHRFPNVLFNIRKGDLDKYEGNCRLLHELGANNPTIYYNNCAQLERTTMGCVDGDEGIWCRINGNIKYYTFYELSELFNADYGVTPIFCDFEVLTLSDDKKVEWHKASNFVKNKNRQMYKVTLSGNKSFICDDTHGLITFKGLNKKPILECTKGSNLIDVSCKDVNIDFSIDYKAALMGFWLGDGAKTVKYGDITVSKNDKKQYLINVFDKAGIEYELIHKTRPIDSGHINPNIYSFKFKKLDLKDFDLNKLEVCAGLLSGLLASDGYIRKTGTFKNSLGAEFVSTDLNISKLFKYCCFMLGLKFSSTKHEGVKKTHNPFERVYISCNSSTIHTLKQLYLRTSQKEVVNLFEEDMFEPIRVYKGQRVQNIELLDKRDSFCLEVNGRMVMGDDFILTSQCRTSLPMNYTGGYDEDCLNTGNFMYSTINLPLIALEHEKDFYEYLNNVCESIYEFLHWRRETVRKIIYENKISTFLLWEDVETGKPLYNFDTTSMSIGFCGLYECLKANPNFDGEEILKFLNKKKDEFHSRDGLRWSVFATPAESTSFKFGKIIREKYPEFELNGGARPYLTNSTHLPVNQENTIIDHIQNADKYHKYTGAGNILHIWLGEVWSDPKSLWKLNQKIINTNTIFWAYSKVFSWCKTCGWTINDNIKECQMCGEKEDILVYDRITGYYLPIKTWNDGKLAEFKDRYRQRGLDIDE